MRGTRLCMCARVPPPGHNDTRQHSHLFLTCRIKAKRETLATLRKKYNKTEDDLKALQVRACARALTIVLCARGACLAARCLSAVRLL